MPKSLRQRRELVQQAKHMHLDRDEQHGSATREHRHNAFGACGFSAILEFRPDLRRNSLAQ